MLSSRTTTFCVVLLLLCALVAAVVAVPEASLDLSMLPLLQSDYVRHLLPLDRAAQRFSVRRSGLVAPATLMPLVILPSLIGNKLEAQLNHSVEPHFFCWKNAEWFLLWLDESDLLPLVVDCFLNNLNLSYGGAGVYTSPRGVQVRAMTDAASGNTAALEYLDNNQKLPVWHAVLSALRAVGYKDGVSLFAAPFDWRRGPDWFVPATFPPLQALIENVSAANNDSKVMLTSLSFGCPYTVRFLNAMSAAWKARYVAGFVSVSGPYAGSTWALAELTGGDSSNITRLVDFRELRSVIQTWGANAWLLPSAELFANQTLISSPTRNWTSSDADQLDAIAQAGSSTAAFVLKTLMASGERKLLSDPGVPVFCVYGTGVPTMSSISYTHAVPPFTNDYATQLVDGDGTVVHDSLALCGQWANAATFQFANMTHDGSIADPRSIAVLLQSLGFQNVSLA